MSYARFGWDGSDVYVYLDVGGYYTCCACIMDRWPQFYSTADLIAHLQKHREAGHIVPEDTFAQLREEGEENDQWIDRMSKHGS